MAYYNGFWMRPIRINSDLSVDFSKAKGKISDYDRNAIEAAVKLAKPSVPTGGLTFGSSKTRQSLKDALSRGLEEAFWVKAEEAGECRRSGYRPGSGRRN